MTCTRRKTRRHPVGRGSIVSHRRVRDDFLSHRLQNTILDGAFYFFFQAEDGIRDYKVTGVQTCALPICMPPTHRLVLRFNTSRSSLMLDPATALPSSENYGIDAQYNLIDLATNKSVMTGTTFSRVSYDIPGQLQRFARQRAFRDAEDRAANEIAENIQTRLASFFYAGT